MLRQESCFSVDYDSRFLAVGHYVRQTMPLHVVQPAVVLLLVGDDVSNRASCIESSRHVAATQSDVAVDRIVYMANLVVSNEAVLDCCHLDRL